MNYISTRGDKKTYTAKAAIIKGLADDGGLFVPDNFPRPYTDADALKSLQTLEYADLAYEIMKHFLTDFTENELKSCISAAYTCHTADANFDDDAIAPLVSAGNTYFLELFHGKTLAFKDMALSILPHLMKTASKSIANNDTADKILVLTATSGDTGKAAMEGFKDVEGISVLVFYPKDGTSEIQRLQMVTQEGGNVAAAAIVGNFDDAQSAVKAIFEDADFTQKLKDRGITLSSANSINIGRLIPQIVYYFYAYFALVKSEKINLLDKVNFCVPTGNFGNILAGYYAKQMGLPIDKLICAANENNVLCDFINTGKYDRNRVLHLTASPSMDILVSSNLERLLYMLSNADTNDMMTQLRNEGTFTFDAKLLENAGFIGSFATDAECFAAISDEYENTGYIMDTHTAVAFRAAKSYGQSVDNAPTVIVSTASPYKFPASVLNAIDRSYKKYDEYTLLEKLAELLAEDVPPQLKDINQREIRHNSVIEKADIRNWIEKWDKL